MKTLRKSKTRQTTPAFLLMVLSVGPGGQVHAQPLGTAFTYQGQLNKLDQPVAGECTFNFTLWDAEFGGNQIGSEYTAQPVQVDAGLFITDVDFGSNGATGLDGHARWLKVEVMCVPDTVFSPLTARQRLNPAPYALALPGLYTQEDPGPTDSPNLIGGYSGNAVATGAIGATISGGGRADDGGGEPDNNRVTDSFGNVGGGESNTASGFHSTVGGGLDNLAFDHLSTVAGGESNVAFELYSTVGGGYQNTALGQASTVPGGLLNFAQAYGFAAGRQAKAIHVGAFVWGDSSGAAVNSSTDNQFTARCSGGVRFFTNSSLSTGVQVPAGGGSWSSASDRNAKENFEPVNPREVLDRVSKMPIETWNYKSQDAGIRHVGPVAQDFKAAFGVGEDDTHITTIDADGVALAAIQGLYEIVQEKDCEIEALQALDARKDDRIKELEARLGAIEALMARSSNPTNGGAQ